MLLRLAVISLVSLFLAGCGVYNSWYTPPDPKTGYYGTYSPLKNKEIFVNEPINLGQYKRLLVVAVKNSSFAGTGEIGSDEIYWQKSLQGLGVFDHVVLTENLPKFFQDQNQSNKLLENFVDLESLSAAEKIYGNFLVMEISSYSDSQSTVMVISVINPSDGKVYFKVKREKFSLVNDKNNLYYPILNGFKYWLQHNAQS